MVPDVEAPPPELAVVPDPVALLLAKVQLIAVTVPELMLYRPPPAVLIPTELPEMVQFCKFKEPTL
jgi:hypothetical protein